jgi:membrane protease YdiL (CAAX protease family)
MNRLARFLRSVIPIDPWQLCLLAGIFCFILAPLVSWRTSSGAFASRIQIDWWMTSQSPVGVLEVIFGAFALYSCFWPGSRPIKRVALAVLAPVLAASVYVLWFLNYQQRGGQTSLFERHNELQQMAELLQTQFRHFPPTFYFLLMALVLTLLFVSRMALGASTLPLSLPTPKNTTDENTTWRAALLLNVLFVSGVSRVILTVTLITLFEIGNRAHLPMWLSRVASSSVSLYLVGGAILIAIAAAVLGKPGWQQARQVLRFSGMQSLLLAAALTTSITLAGVAAEYLFDRAQWATHHDRMLDAPRFADYFSWLRGWSSVLVFAGAAFAEELVFRGVMLRLCTRRFGLYRGIFLTSVAFVLFHVPNDSYTRLSVVSVLLHLVLRLISVLPMSYVLAWMTLRWKSILPAWIAHSFYNAFRAGESSLDWQWQAAAWALAALLLYRYLAPAEPGEEIRSAAIDSAPIADATAG